MCRRWSRWCASSGWRAHVPKQAVLLLAHGTPETVEQIPEYLRNVVSGRPVPQAVVEEIQHRYSLIGKSPLTEITMAQARLVEAELNGAGEPSPAPHPSEAWMGHPASHPSDKNKDVARMEHPRIPVHVGMRNWRPYIPEVVRQMRADGVEEAVVICMAPQNSRTSVGLYRRAAEAEAGGLRIDFTAGWAEHPLLADAFAERLRPAWAKLSAEVGEPVPVLFTAHSVPTRTVEAPAAGADSASHPSAKQRRREGGAPGTEVVAGSRHGGRSLCRGCATDCGTGCGEGAGDSAMVVCIPEPGRERRTVDWPQRGGNAGSARRRRGEGAYPAADWISLRSC